MALTDLQLKRAKVPAEKKQIKLSDGGGLYLLVTKPGGKHWKIGYRFPDSTGKPTQRVISLGAWPALSLQAARARRDEIKVKLREGIDPAAERKSRLADAVDAQRNLFSQWAMVWHKQNVKNKCWSSDTAKDALARLNNYLIPKLGTTPIVDITRNDILDVVDPIHSLGHRDTARTVLLQANSILDCALRAEVILRNVAQTIDLVKELGERTHKKHPAIFEAKALGELLRDIWGYSGKTQYELALKLSVFVALRPIEVRHIEPHEVHLDAREIRIPAEKMKKAIAHIVPLSDQAVLIAEQAIAVHKEAGGKHKYLFGWSKNESSTIGKNSISGVLHELGYYGNDTNLDDHVKGKQSWHGFRGTFSSVCNGSAHVLFDDIPTLETAVELQLAHLVKGVRAHYMTSAMMGARIIIMQRYADYLCSLRDRTPMPVIVDSKDAEIEMLRKQLAELQEAQSVGLRVIK